MIMDKRIKEYNATASMKFKQGLALLIDDNLKEFKEEFGKNGDYYLTLVSYNDPSGFAYRLKEWQTYLETFPDCQHKRGGIEVIKQLVRLFTEISKLDNEN